MAECPKAVFLIHNSDVSCIRLQIIVPSTLITHKILIKYCNGWLDFFYYCRAFKNLTCTIDSIQNRDNPFHFEIISLVFLLYV